ncbi:MAG: helix-turn-helix domain-containing protein [Chloroflexi bacterium]|nr:helix-turn-helix domain-containing protein [Chloroflexota bacterium]
MTSVLDVWRWVDPAARIASGSVERLQRPVRGVDRTRAAPPHLPPRSEGHLLVVDAHIVTGGLEALVAAVGEAGLDPAAIWVAPATNRRFEDAGAEVPILSGELPPAEVERRAARHLDQERGELASFAAGLRLAAAEAALADLQPAAPAGVVADRLRRGVAVSIGGDLAALTPRHAGRALATRFAAFHGRRPAMEEPRVAAIERRHTRDGLWLLERRIEAGGRPASAWIFDDLPLARVDEVALEALATTLRALLRRPSAPPSPHAERRLPPSTGDPLQDTLLAVARSNGRIAPAARILGVHRNTVLHRLRRASAELGIDPRRPDDALRLLRKDAED